MPSSDKANPKDQQTITKSSKVVEFVTKTVSDVTTDQMNLENYYQKLRRAYDQRMMKVDLTLAPWPGAPMVSMPFTDKIIRKRKSVFAGAFLNVSKRAAVNVAEGVPDPEGVLKQKAINSEKALNFYLREKMGWDEALILAMDYMQEKGRVYFKVFEQLKNIKIARTIDLNSLRKKFGKQTVDAIKDLESEEIKELFITQGGFGFDRDNDDHMDTLDQIIKEFKSGEDVIEYQLEDIQSIPKIEPLSPNQVIIPFGSPRQVDRMVRFSHEFYMSEQELRNAVDEGIFDKKVVDDRLATGKNSNQDTRRVLEVTKDVDEGEGRQEDFGRFKLWEMHVYWKAPNEKDTELWVVTSFAKDQSGQFLRVIREPTPDGKMPFLEVDNEIRDDRALSSRGVPEMLRHVQDVIDQQENNRIHRDVINNTPWFTVRRQSGIQSSSIQFIPGQGLVVDNHDDVKNQKLINSTDIASERIEATVKQFGEEYMGQIDFAINAGSVQGVGRGTKTLGEVQVAQSEAQKIIGIDFTVLNNSIGKVYEMVFNLLRDRFDESIEIDGTVITKDDFNFPAEVKANGSLEESDKTLKVNKALARIQVMSQQDPSYVTIEDRFNSYIDYLEADGVKDVQRFSTSPVEVMQDQTVQLQQQIQQQAGTLQQLQEAIEDSQKTLKKTQDKVKEQDSKSKAIREEVLGTINKGKQNANNRRTSTAARGN